METNELVPSVSIAAVVNARAAILERFDQAAAVLAQAAQLAQANGYLHVPAIMVDTGGGGRWSNVNISEDGAARAAFVRALDRSAWHHLMNASGLMTFMDAEARNKWREQLEGKEIPELTLRNVEATFLTLQAGRGDMFERGVINVFKGLSWDYKTNSPFKFGKRFVLRYLKDWADSTYPAFNASNKLDDLVRVLSVLDGKPEPDHRTGLYNQLQQAMSEPGQRLRGEADTEYLRVKWFKNKSGHITFKRLDLVDRLNAIIAKHYPGALPAPQE